MLCYTQQLPAQKIDVNENTVTVDGKPYAQIEKEGCKMLSAKCEYTIKNSTGKTLIVISTKDIILPEERSQSNPTGRVPYAQYVFLDSIGQKAEIKRVYTQTDKLVKFLLKSELIKNDALDPEAVRTFVLVNGTPFSDRRKH